MSVSFPSRTATVSGATLSTVFSGTGILMGVFINPLSGAQASFSGQVIRVQDAVSGMGAIGSGNAIFFNFDFGFQSGLTNGLNNAVNSWNAADLPYMLGFCNSGLVVQGAASWNTTISYNK